MLRTRTKKLKIANVILFIVKNIMNSRFTTIITKEHLNIRLFTQVSYISNYESIKHLFSEISSIEFIYKFIEVEL